MNAEGQSGAKALFTELTPASNMSSAVISCPFEPAHAVIFDNYPYDNYEANGNAWNFGNNGDLPALLSVSESYYFLSPYSASNGSPQWRKRSETSLLSYADGSATISLGSNAGNKSLLAGHRYTIVLLSAAV